MIQDILYAIKYDKIENLKLSPDFIEHLEEKVAQGDTYISNHPIIMCLEYKKANYITHFLEKGFSFNFDNRNKSLLYSCLSNPNYQKYFLDLLNQGANLLEKEEKKALSALCRNANKFDTNFIEIAKFLMENKYYDNLKSLMYICYQTDSVMLFNMILEHDEKSIKSNGVHNMKLSLEHDSFNVAQKFLDYNENVDLKLLDMTFFSSEAKEFILSYQEKIKLEKEVSSNSFVKRLKL
jgi:hypothetical protein